MQFEQAQGVTTAAPSCKLCQTPIAMTYYETGGEVICPSCRERALAGPSGNAIVGLALGAALGFGAAMLSALGQATILYVAEINAAIVWIFLVAFIAAAIRKGSGGRGGLLYQLMGLALLYLSIGASLGMAYCMMEAKAGRLAVSDVAIGLPFVAIMWPTLGAGSPISWIIYAIAGFTMFQATARPVIEINGPFQLAPKKADPPLDSDAGNDP